MTNPTGATVLKEFANHLRRTLPHIRVLADACKIFVKSDRTPEDAISLAQNMVTATKGLIDVREAAVDAIQRIAREAGIEVDEPRAQPPSDR